MEGHLIKKYGFNTLRECLIEIGELENNKKSNKSEIIKKLQFLSTSMTKVSTLQKELKNRTKGNFSSEYNSYLRAKKNGNNKMIQEKIKNLKNKYGNNAINNYLQTHSQNNLLNLNKEGLKKVATNYFNKNYKSESLKPKERTISFMNNNPKSTKSKNNVFKRLYNNAIRRQHKKKKKNLQYRI